MLLRDHSQLCALAGLKLGETVCFAQPHLRTRSVRIAACRWSSAAAGRGEDETSLFLEGRSGAWQDVYSLYKAIGDAKR
ncbi:uncharacterized [Tachysurus ichikawai]